jgi:preprotein translocase subunit SecD
VASAPAQRVGRYLAGLLVVVVAAYGLLFWKGYTPKLGLDLRGGVSVILTPKVEGGGRVSSAQLQQAVDIIRQRVNGVGVAEAEVVTQGQNIIISVPGKGREVVQQLGSTAQLRFREVIQETPTGPAVAPSAVPAPGTPTAPTPAPSGATPAPSGATPAPSGATPAPSGATPSPQGRALSGALLDTAPPASTAPAAPDVPTPTPAAAAPATPTPADASPPPPGAATDPLAVAFAALDCSQPANRQGNSSVDKPTEEIVACDRDGKAKYLLAPATVVGTDVKGATARLDPAGTNQWQVGVTFTGGGQKKFTDLTAATVGKQVAIVLDGVVISAPVIQNTIPGDAQITGNFSKDEAQNLANVLKYGALPLTFTTSQAEVVSPTLGTDQLHAGLLAGGIGLALVVLYSLLYYRGLGLVTIASLALAGVITYAAVAILGAQIGFTLTLAGIAGLIVAIGITADSFVVFFERVKDEVRDGRTLRSAVDRGWVRARRTIVSADFVSFLAAASLYFLSVLAVRGFAFTLGLSTIIDLALVFFFTHPLMTLLARSRTFSRPGFTGMGRLPAPAVPVRRPGRPAARRAVTTKGSGR